LKNLYFNETSNAETRSQTLKWKIIRKNIQLTPQLNSAGKKVALFRR